MPRPNVAKFVCFWSAEGDLPLRSITLAPGHPLVLSHDREGVVFTFTEELTIHAGEELVLLA
jgi:hypothetical protein